MLFFLWVVLSLLVPVMTSNGRQGQRQQSLSARKFPRYDFFSRKGSLIKKDPRPLGFGPSKFLSMKVKGALPRKNSAAAKDTNIADLVSMVSSLTNMLEEQARVIKKLEVQTELLALLLKDSTKSKSNKALSKTTTLAPSKLISTSTIPSSYSDWNYSNQGTWSSEYPSCGEENQSPIDLHTVGVALKDHKSPISFSSYDMLNKDTCMVTNNGNTVTISMKTGGTNTTTKPILSGGPFDSTKYLFTQAVFHWGADSSQGSEHTIRGTTYPLEMQLIHQTSSREESDLAITSFLFEESDEENPYLAGLMTGISKIRIAGTEAELGKPDVAIEDENTNEDKKSEGAADSFSMDLLIKDSVSGPYFTYPGSQTFPPCTEVKQYVVFREPIDISSTQLEQFRLLLQLDGTRVVNNFRSLQTLGNRVLAFTVSSDLISKIFNL